MTWWRVATTEKKNVEEHELWQKDDWVIRRITGYRWGTFSVETPDDNPPTLEQDSGPGADAVDMYNTDYYSELVSLDDGWYADVIWPDEMPDEERERLEELWEEDSYGGWEEEGWVQYDNECWFCGPLEIVLDDEKDLDQDIESVDLYESPTDTDEDVTGPRSTWPFPTGNPNKG